GRTRLSLSRTSGSRGADSGRIGMSTAPTNIGRRRTGTRTSRTSTWRRSSMEESSLCFCCWPQLAGPGQLPGRCSNTNGPSGERRGAAAEVMTARARLLAREDFSDDREPLERVQTGLEACVRLQPDNAEAQFQLAELLRREYESQALVQLTENAAFRERLAEE